MLNHNITFVFQFSILLHVIQGGRGGVILLGLHSDFSGVLLVLHRRQTICLRNDFDNVPIVSNDFFGGGVGPSLSQ